MLPGDAHIDEPGQATDLVIELPVLHPEGVDHPPDVLVVYDGCFHVVRVDR